MPLYRIHRLRDSQRLSFRWKPHTSGVTNVKPRDYEEEGAAEALTPYALWHEMKGREQPLELGDLLESPDGELYICKYVGFERARWVLPEMKTGIEAAPAAAGQPQVATG